MTPAVMHASRMPKWIGALAGIVLLVALPLCGLAASSTKLPTRAQDVARTLDAFDAPSRWKIVASDQVHGALRAIDGVDGRALCLDYDFHGVSGYVGMQRDLPLDFPDDYAFAFKLRGETLANDLQFKLIDASGDNVWWAVKPGYIFPAQWTPVVYKMRHIGHAWGPATDPTLRHSAKIEFTIASGAGGNGSICFDSLTFERRIPDDGSPLSARATATEGSDAAFAVDGDPATAWRGSFSETAVPMLILDLGHVREFGGLSLQWLDAFASDYVIELSNDARQWHAVRRVHGSNGGRDWITLPESEARYVRLTLSSGPGIGYALAEVTIQPLAVTATTNDFIKSVAKASPRGWYPRGFSGEQPYWTIVGINGGIKQGQIDEDGAVEFEKGGASVMPFVLSDGKLVTWADVASTQSLQDGYLPIPSVQWKHHDFGLRVTAFARGDHAQSQILVRYRLTNTTPMLRDYVLALSVQPFQVNPPSQFLNTQGGVVPIGFLALANRYVGTDEGTDAHNFHFIFHNLEQPDAVLATAFDQGMVAERLSKGEAFSNTNIHQQAAVMDDASLASGALLYRMHLRSGESREVSLYAPLSEVSNLRGPNPLVNPTNEEPDAIPAFDVAAAQRIVAAQWHDKLDRVRIRVPEAGQHVVDTLHTALANMLISRNGPRLQPGTRSYARAWIRDGAMISEALLRMGPADVAEQFLRWYAPYQFDDGKVPCCVDDRGSDPVPENDSHGELLFAIAEVYRYTHDRKLLADMWPHVIAAVAYMDRSRLSERTEANRALNPAFYGMMPASISHEGYSAKPMHSYWDDFWTLRGYKDAVQIAQWLGHDAEAKRFSVARDQFSDDLYASIAASTKSHDIDYIPGAAELGDFDATSTTIALSPGGEQDRLPQAQLENTFARYWREFIARRDGNREWTDYTPYELRTIGAFVRLGWRDRAQQALDFFIADQQPRGWNQWAEVVSHTPRKPFFLGDLPHAWVASDYVRSVLDMFAYTRDRDDALVIAAGLPASWLRGEGVAIEGLQTPHGTLSYTLRFDGRRTHLRLLSGLRIPLGGIVLQLPHELVGGKARINGVPVSWHADELRIDRVPADVVIESR